MQGNQAATQVELETGERTPRERTFQKFYPRGITALLNGHSLKFKLSYLFKYFRYQQTVFSVQLLSLPSFESDKRILEFTNFNLRVWRDVIDYDVITGLLLSVLLSKKSDCCLLFTCQV